MILYLDFDGVLHPDAVYPSKEGLVLRAPGELFMHADILIEAIKVNSDIEIVLSTSWVSTLGYQTTLNYMPKALRERVLGATYYKQSSDYYTDHPFDNMTRFEQIHEHVKANVISNWIAIDDLHSNTQDWPLEYWPHLVICDGNKGLGDEETQADLNTKLLEFRYG